MTQLNVTITMHTQWHAGTGSGGGSDLDAVIKRELNLPVLPGTTLKGLARDRAAVVQAATGVRLAEKVFGTKQHPGRWHFGSARMTSVEEVKTFLSRHNRHDPATGRVPDDYFFSLEAAPPAGLTAVVEPLWRVDEDQEIAFVVACLMAIDRVGSRRHRGWGRCTVDVTGSDGRGASALLAPLFEEQPA